MTRWARHVVFATGLGALVLAGCGDTETVTETVEVEEARVVIGGNFDVQVGKSITLTAETRNGQDSGYTWASSDEAIATVADGVVTGVKAGVVTITATGVTSLLSGERGVVVTAIPETPGVVDPATPVVRVTGDYAVEVGGTVALTAETLNGEDTGYSWASQNTDVATVDGKGLVTAVKSGVATITATGVDSGAQGAHGIVVAEEPVIIPPPPDPEVVVTVTGGNFLKPTQTLTLTATTANGEDGSYAWSSSDPAVATVTAGVVTGVADGEAIITAKGADTGKEGKHGIVVRKDPEPPVEPPPPTPVVIVDGETLLEPGQTTVLSVVTVNGEDSGYDWSTSNGGVASVDVGGVVTANGDGVAVITATGKDTKVTDKHTIVVAADVPLPVPVVSVVGDFTVDLNGTLALSAATVNGVDSGYTWQSSNPSVAPVDADGLVHGNEPGEAIISATGVDTGATGSLGIVVVGNYDPQQPPFFDQWVKSAHADSTALAFNNWNAQGAIPTGCAKCHSSPGYIDFLGGDGSAVGIVDKPAPTGTVVSCETCHNAATQKLDTVTFPSGVTITGYGADSRCMTCHQGRASTPDVDDKITAAALADDDTVSAALSFTNIHYLAAGATLLGSEVQGAYQYAGKLYDKRNHHVENYRACTGCHNQHTLELRFDECAQCHTGVTDVASIEGTIRMFGSTGDYDGDGNRSESIKQEMDGLGAELLKAITAYAKDVAGTAIVYDSHTHPYFFIDTDGDGVASAEEAVNANKYVSFTPRLLRAAYNYQYWQKDPGTFAHNGKYVIQVMVDSIEDLNGALPATTGFAGDRGDGGHFDGGARPWRNWDAQGAVPANCSKCHSGEGNRFFHTYGITKASAPGNGLTCATCHSTVPGYALHAVSSVTFPGSKVVTSLTPADNLCATCHSGRESKKTVDDYIAGGGLGFRNVHYLPAAATLLGSEAGVGYEFDGKTYAGKSTHLGGTACVQCHSPVNTKHSFTVEDNVAWCNSCHGTNNYKAYRLLTNYDIDGDGNKAEPLGEELSSLADDLYAQIQAVAAGTGKPVVYDGHTNPYFFADTNGDGVGQPTEIVSANSYKGWTPALMKAAFNFQLYQKEPGAWAHNVKYTAQLLIDSIESLGGDVSKYARP